MPTKGIRVRALLCALSLVTCLAIPTLATPAVATPTVATPAVATTATDLRVVSFNIRYGTADDGDHAWPHRLPQVRATIDTLRPDLLGLQECLADQRDTLAAALPGFAVVATGRDDGAEQGEMCACFYRHDRFDRLEHGTFWLSETPAVVGSRGWDAALPRIATWVRLRDRASGRGLLWLNAHLDHRGAESRREAAALIHRWLTDHRGDADLVVTGDFNASATGRAHHLLRHGHGAGGVPLLVDTWNAAHGPGGGPGTYHGFTGEPRSARIDWVLASPHLPVREATVVDARAGARWPSDHFPVLATLQAGAAPAARAVARNLAVPDAFAVPVIDSLLAGEQDRPTARRVGDWAVRLAAVGDLGYRFGLAAGGYVAEGRLAPGRWHDCISLVYRATELARATSARDALAVALATRFAGAPLAEVIGPDGRVDYEHPAHLDHSIDMIRSGHWGCDVTGALSGARRDGAGSSRYPPATVTVAPQADLVLDELQHGDVVWFVLAPGDTAAAALRREHGLMVGHAGLIARDGGTPWLVHAASRPLPGWYEGPGVVRVPLADYLARVERYDAVIVTRFAAPPRPR